MYLYAEYMTTLWPLYALYAEYIEKRRDLKVRVALYPEGPVTIYGDDEVDDVDQEHEGVDVAHWAVLRVDDVIEELPDG